MRKSKLIELLYTFDGNEWSQFRDFVASPYFNKNEAVTALCCYLADKAPGLDISKEEAFRALFPAQPFDAKQMGYLMNYLLQLGEQFLSMQRYQGDEFRQRYDSLIAYSNRKLTKHYDFLHKKTRRGLEEKPEHAGLLFDRYKLAEAETVHFSNQKVRRFDPSTQRAYEYLNEYYYCQVLNYTCSMLSWQMVVSGDFKLSPVTRKLIQSLQEEPLEEYSPLVAIYLKIYYTISTKEPENDRHFAELMQLINQYGAQLEQAEGREVYLYAINFCVRKIRKEEGGHYASMVLRLYEDGIRSGALFENGYLSHWTYTNVVKLALLEQKYDWTEKFILNYKDDLPPASYDDAFHYNLAELYFNQKNYSEALGHLQHLNFTDPYYNLGSRIVLIKTFYELDEEESLLSLLASFTIFLKRNKNLSSAYKKTCLNFCKLLHQVLKRNPNKRHEVKKQIETAQPLAERPWLLKVWEEI